MKKYLSKTHLEETIMNMLLKCAEENSSLESFSLESIKASLEKRYDVDDKELKTVLDGLIEKNKIENKEKRFEVFIPSKFVKTYEKLSTPQADELIILVSLFLGNMILPWILNYTNFNIQINLSDISQPQMTLVYFNLFSVFIGAILVVITINAYRTLYSKINFFREFIEFFGGSKVWKYALILGIGITLIYTIFTWVTKYELNPYFATALFSATFIAVLGLGHKRNGLNVVHS